MDSYYNRMTHNGIKYHLREGTRNRNGNTLTAWADILADCTKCDQSIGIELMHFRESHKVLDDDAAVLFRRNGWDIDLTTKPKIVLCPICKNKMKQCFTVNDYR
jgi:hypothetical protein